MFYTLLKNTFILMFSYIVYKIVLKSYCI